MTKPSTERQRKLVALRKSQGLKRMERWVTATEERKLDIELKRIRKEETK